ncbi:Sulfotransferase [Nostocoides japonicum T1-X7]|uniref:Sulfotransferase n=1 Tax=Nostocoides japonicum T1-X7 TaxID=1194083 RepID=A0A077LZ26_9MICO|nr:sulfotransferase [Tetrasphaera japonica]CCH78157.1 Sulfotransferase [Tetrasphaera japonica T1-X7]
MSLKRFGDRLLVPARLAVRRDRMAPSYVIVGTKRGGSTALAAWVGRHPQVAPCRSGKGTHYFDVNHLRGEAWFRSQFPSPREPWRVTGEASPYYMFHPLAAGWIRESLPDAKVIAVLRDPAERAWSHYRREVDTGYETLSFVDALSAEPERLDGEEARIMADPRYDSTAHRHHSYAARGRYAEQIARLHGLFGSDRVLVLQSESLFIRPNVELARVWDFLGLQPVTLDGLRPMKPSTGSSDRPHEIIEGLRDHFLPLNERLYELPGIDFRWTGATAS